MCGITGILNFNGSVVDKLLLRRMTDVLSYRGPDGEGFYVDKNVGLGHRRLAIIDLSDAGKQPMCNHDGTIWITFNGEIYNFQELRRDLEGRGYRFSSSTDTEVIIHAYEEYGVDCVGFLRGMFSFAVWDVNKKQLFLVRDRVGKKPLVYYKDNDRFVFASEIKAIIEDKTIKREVSQEALSNYLGYGYVPAPLTIFKNIYKLLPGHCMIVDNKGNITIKQYWDLQFKETNFSEDYYCKKTLELLEESTKIRMFSDVPLGAFLSGGVDSSAVVAMMAKNSEQPIKTFSIGFEEQEFNELPYARIIAEKFNTDHKEFIVKPDAIKILPKLVWYYDEPFADSSALPSYYLAQLTKKHVTVSLNGDGGDENYAGYDRIKAMNVLKIYKKVPKFARRIINYSVEKLPEKRIIKSAKRFTNASNYDVNDSYYSFLNMFSDREKDALLQTNKYYDSSKIMKDEFNKCSSNILGNKILYFEIKRYLSDDLLIKIDIATMANSLEARSPFLDHKMMEFTATIPFNLKVKRLKQKYILTKALKHIIPKKILNRKKQGFVVPINSWFRNDLKNYSYDLLNSNEFKSRNLFDYYQVNKLLDEHQSNRDHKHKIWSLLWLELWFREFIDKY